MLELPLKGESRTVLPILWEIVAALYQHDAVEGFSFGYRSTRDREPTNKKMFRLVVYRSDFFNEVLEVMQELKHCFQYCQKLRPSWSLSEADPRYVTWMHIDVYMKDQQREEYPDLLQQISERKNKDE